MEPLPVALFALSLAITSRDFISVVRQWVRLAKNHIFKAVKMSQSTTFSVVRSEFPSGLSNSSRIHLVSMLSRWCDKYPGRVISNPDSSFVLTDLDGLSLGGFTHILETFGCVYSIRLVSRAFFDKLFDSDFAKVG